MAGEQASCDRVSVSQSTPIVGRLLRVGAAMGVPVVAVLLVLFVQPARVDAAVGMVFDLVFVGTTDVEFAIAAFWNPGGGERKGPVEGRLYRDGVQIATFGETPTVRRANGGFDVWPARFTDKAAPPFATSTYRLEVQEGTEKPVSYTLMARAGELAGVLDHGYSVEGGSWLVGWPLTVRPGGHLKISGATLAGASIPCCLQGGISLQGGSLTVERSTLRGFQIGGRSNTPTGIVSIERSLLDRVIIASGLFFSTFRYNSAVCAADDLNTVGLANHFNLGGGLTGQSTVVVGNALPGCKVAYEPVADTGHFLASDNVMRDLYISAGTSGAGTPRKIDTLVVLKNVITSSLQVAGGSGAFRIAGNEVPRLSLGAWQTATSTGVATQREVSGNRVVHSPTGGGLGLNEVPRTDVIGNEIECRGGGGGIGISGSPASRVVSNTIANCGDPLDIAGGLFGENDGMVVRGNVLSGGPLWIGASFVGDVSDNDIDCHPTRQETGLQSRASDSRIERNRIRNCKFGIGVGGAQRAARNVIRGNVLVSNTYGIVLGGPVEANTIVDNAIYAGTAPGSQSIDLFQLDHNSCTAGTCTNVWSLSKQAGANVMGGPFLGGNFYSDFPNVDADDDKLGDNPRTLAAGNVDQLPLFDAAIIVNSTGDDPDADPNDGRCDTDLATAGSQCTLRAAIDLANRIAGPNTVRFAIPVDGTPNIQPRAPLPAISGDLILDGSTQPSSGRVEVTGEHASDASPGLRIDSGDVTLRNLGVSYFGGTGVRSTGSGTVSLDNVSLLGNCGSGVEAEGSIALAGSIRARQNAFGSITCDGGDGIRSNRGSVLGARLRSIDLVQNRDAGIVTTASAGDVTLVNAHIERNGSRGIQLKDGTLTLLGDANAITGNGSSGILIVGPRVSAVTIDGAVVADNGGYGIWTVGPVEVRRQIRVDNNADGGIRADGGAIFGAEADAFEVTSNGRSGARQGSGIMAQGPVRLQNARVSDNGGNGIYVTGGFGLGFVRLYGANNEVSSNGATGIFGPLGGTITADGLAATDNDGWGIWVGGSVNVGKSLRVNGNKQGGIRSGIGAVMVGRTAAPVEVIGNGEANPPAGHGILAPDGAYLWNARILRNKGNGISTNGPVWLMGSTNVIADNASTGIFGTPSTAIRAEGLEVSRNGGWGIWVGGSIEVDRSLRAVGNDQGGVRTSAMVSLATGDEPAGHSVEIVSNGSGNPGSGHGIQTGDDAFLRNAVIVGNSGNGIQAAGRVRIRGVGNDISQNTSSGIFARGGDVDGRNVTARRNGGDGIRASAGLVTLRSATICRNVGAGIRAASADLVSVKVCDNQGGGVVLTGPTAESAAAGLAAARVRAAASPSTITSSNVVTNTGDGIAYSGSNGLAVSSSNVYGNSGAGLTSASSAPVSASSVYWGSPTAAASVSGTVSVSSNLTQPIALVASVDPASLAIVPGQAGAFSVAAQNFQNPTDTVRIIVSSDTLRWNQNPTTLDLSVDESGIISTTFGITVPASAAPGTQNVIPVSVASLTTGQTERMTVTVSAIASTAPISVGITSGVTGTADSAATFSALVSPITATSSFTWTWQATGQTEAVHTDGTTSDAVSFTWAVTGTQRVTVTAASAVGAVSASRAIVITGTPEVTTTTPISPTTPITPTAPTTPTYMAYLPTVLNSLAGGW